VTPTKAVVLAQARSAGHGRPSPRPACTNLPPAPLLPAANRTLLGHALDWLAQAGVREAAVIVPQELADQARQAAVDLHPTLSVSWVEQLPDELLAHTMGDLPGFLDGEPFVLHLADSLAKQSLRSLTAGWTGREAEAEAVLMIDESRAVELTHVVQLRAAVGGGPASQHMPRSDAAGVAVMSSSALEAMADLDATPEHLLETLMERIQQRGGRIRTCGVTEWWRFRGGSEALLEGNRFALEGRRADYDGTQFEDSTMQGAVIVHPEAELKSSVVRGPAIIGARARLRDAYVGPYTSIGEDVVIEGAEIEHSVVLPGASISHLGGRLEASVIGPKSRVFRDFRLPRALRLTVGEGAEVSLT
jgi:glucose-1-phosphate thymidylyltransferase